MLVAWVKNYFAAICLVRISLWLYIPFNQKGYIIPAAIPSQTKWKESVTCFFKRQECVFLAFWITLKLSPKILVGDEPSLGIGTPIQRSMYRNDIASSITVCRAINSVKYVPDSDCALAPWYPKDWRTSNITNEPSNRTAYHVIVHIISIAADTSLKCTSKNSRKFLSISSNASG